MPPKAAASRPQITNVEQLRVALTHSKASIRKDALDDMIELFRRPSEKNGVLKEKEYHSLFEALFHLPLLERNSRSSSKSGNKNAIERLAVYSEALRVTVTRSLVKLRRTRVVRSVVDHIMDVLSDQYVEDIPRLVANHMRTLVAVLGHSPLVESLAIEDKQHGNGWLVCADFILNRISSLLEEMNSSTSGLEVLGRDSPIPGTYSTRLSAISNLRGSSQQQQSELTLWLQCLMSMVSTPNAPCMEHRQRITDVTLGALRLRLTLGRLQRFAFATLNYILLKAASNDPNLGRKVAPEAIPLISYWWQPRASDNDDFLFTLRDEMLKTMHGIHLYLEGVLREGSPPILSSQLEDLLDTLWNEYSQRSQQARLRFDDLTFSSMGLPSGHLRISTFALRPFVQDAERRWVLLETTSRLEYLFARYVELSSQQTEVEDSDGHPRKRRRFNAGSNRIHQKMLSPNVEIKLTALQLIPFFFCHSTATAEDVFSTVDDLMSVISNKTGVLSAWAMIACAGAAIQPHAKQESMKSKWKQVWQLAVRSLTIQTTARAACVLLSTILDCQLLPHHVVTDDTNNIITMADICGPSVLSDSSLDLMRRLADMRNEMVPSAIHKTSSHVIRWIFSVWKPADATTALLHAANTVTIDLVNLLLACCGLTPLDGVGFAQLVGGHIHQFWQSIRESTPLTKYLLLLENKTSAEVDQMRPQLLHHQHPEVTPDDIASSSSHSLSTVVLELLSPKVDELLQFLENTSQPQSRRSTTTSVTLSTERLTGFLGCLVSSTVLLPHLQNLESRIAVDFKVLLDNLWEKCFTLILESPQNLEPLELVVLSIVPYLPPLECAKAEQFCSRHPLLLNICARLSELIQRRDDLLTSTKHHDAMDLDDEFDSSNNRSDGLVETSTLPRQSVALWMSSTAFLESSKAKLQFLSEYSKDKSQIGIIPEVVMDALFGLPDDNFLLTQQFVRELSLSDLSNTAVFAKEAILQMGTIQNLANFRACEVVEMIWVDVLLSSAPFWSLTQDDPEYCKPFIDMYNYLVKIAWPNGFLSTEVQISFANLLFRLVELKSTFWEDKAAKVDQPTETLLQLLQTGNLAVKFHIGQRLPDLFALTVLREHDGMIKRVMSALPDESVDGVAIRVLTSAILGCKMPTLLRYSVWYVIEAPRAIPESTNYATFAIKTIAVERSLDSPQRVFRLFAPQLLYTWLNDDSVEEIPYGIFGFASLNDLLADVQTEVGALMVMRGQHEAFDNLASRLQVTTESLIRQGFAKFTAYALAWDLANDQTIAESLIKNVIGKDPFLELIYHNFADIIGNFFIIADQEDKLEKYWRRHEILSYAADNMQAMTNCSHSPTQLPVNQQPSFRGRHLTHQIEYLVRKTKFDVPAFWTPPLVVSVARRLLNTLHPALGPHHALSVVRRIRVLVCLADSQATCLYPLEMLLRSMRPFISDPECADDALGISQWLITNGTVHLSRTPSFVAGYALSALANLRMFLESTQASSSQESQFKDTISKARQFHAWFVRWLKEYRPTAFRSESQEQAFNAIISSASNIRTSGNSQKDTHESTLLLEILKDAEKDDQLLNDSSRDLALKMLCGDFKMPSSNSDDILRSDLDARTHGPMVWKSCQAVVSSREYLTWAGRAVGRSFAASGDIPRDVLRESLLSVYHKTVGGKGDSINGLLRLLDNLTTSDDSICAGLAESVLRTIVSYATRAENRDLVKDCNDSLSDTLFMSSDWSAFVAPPSDYGESGRVLHDPFGRDQIVTTSWAQTLCLHLARISPENGLLHGLCPVFEQVDGFAHQALPYMIHLLLATEEGDEDTMKRTLSAAFTEWLKVDSQEAMPNVKLLINVVLYLRDRPYRPEEKSVLERSLWLDIDYLAAARAAVSCGMFKVALMSAELALSDQTSRGSSRRSSAVRDVEDSSDLLLQIFENIDDPDAYYGLERTASLSNVLARLEYEKEGGKSLAFRGAQYDSHLRMRDPDSARDGQALVQIFSGLGLAGLSESLLQTHLDHDDFAASLHTTFTAARRLEKWSLPAPASLENHAAISYRAFQAVHRAVEIGPAVGAIRESLADTMMRLVSKNLKAADMRQHLGTLAALSELDDVFSASGSTELEQVVADFEARSRWMTSGRYDDVNQILSHRQTTLSMLSRKDVLRTSKITSPEARLVEVRSMLLASKIYRSQQAKHEALNISTALRALVTPSESIGLTIEAAVKMDEAYSLWEYGEMIPSIRLLQGLHESASALKKQSVSVSHAEVLAKIGHQASVAKLETADNIQKNYLEPALKVLKGANAGAEAGQVFHQFAVFCDEQLHDHDMLEDLARLQRLVENKTEEVNHYKNEVSKAGNSQLKGRCQRHLDNARKYLKLDQDEFEHAQKIRNEFVRLSLENFLQSLAASDDHNSDALRFTAMWLERSESNVANKAVHAYLTHVPTWKFAPLMNQLSSRLQVDSTLFQSLLMPLVHRICCDHPYHGMYQIWAGLNARPSKHDEAALRRKEAAKKVASQLIAISGRTQEVWKAIDRTSYYYHGLAVSSLTDKNKEKLKSGSKINIKDDEGALQLASCLSRYKIPPPTMEIELRPDGDYTNVPTIAKLDPTISIAGGVSTPKILTVVASDGEKHRQLVKGSNDDLRQDAIMEQVFASVSSLLKQHRTTRQRNLGIRTYKVLPLTANTGLIEFVANTQPMHDWLIPAHPRYYPKDLRGSQCRKQIEDVQHQSTSTRLNAYRKVTDKFHPVMRYFFLEAFSDPDDWYIKRLAYTRSTAAISILGHVLGLGDRHGHNILMDKKTGEVVHIDLGVAFETGRVLPIPEVVPFRMTRDVVDGMGVTKTDGVFRRCCEFTLDALREDAHSITTILDVLRYDPLHSWSSTPMRLAKLQKAAGGGTSEEDDVNGGNEPMRKKMVTNEPSEADRALEVVRKKLSKTLSVTATVNDLINQATDEKNLAVLYAGWAAYA